MSALNLPKSRARRICEAMARRIETDSVVGPCLENKILFIQSITQLRDGNHTLTKNRLYIAGESLVENSVGTGRHGSQSVATSLVYTFGRTTKDQDSDPLEWLDVVEAIFTALQQEKGELYDEDHTLLTKALLKLDRAPKPVALRDGSVMAVELIATHTTPDFHLENRRDLSEPQADGIPIV